MTKRGWFTFSYKAVLLRAVIMALMLAALAAVGDDISRSAELVGANFRDCAQCPEMVQVDSGSFVMGDESRKVPEEQPSHRVNIPRRIAFSKTKVTVQDWKNCVLAGLCQSLGATSISGPNAVVFVSWVDAQQYLAWLSVLTGFEYRLLSEAEWEYIARNSRDGLSSFGVDGLEWTSDCWHVNYSGAPTDGSSWETGGDCRYHVARGVREGEAPSITRRHRFLFNSSDPALSFRVARTMPD